MHMPALLLVVCVALVGCAFGDDAAGLVVSGARRTAHCSTVGTHGPRTERPGSTGWSTIPVVVPTDTVGAFAGIFHAAAFCPASCFAACAYGCILCKVRFKAFASAYVAPLARVLMR